MYPLRNEVQSRIAFDDADSMYVSPTAPLVYLGVPTYSIGVLKIVINEGASVHILAANALRSSCNLLVFPQSAFIVSGITGP